MDVLLAMAETEYTLAGFTETKIIWSPIHRHGQSDTQTHSYTPCKGLHKKTPKQTMQNICLIKVFFNLY